MASTTNSGGGGGGGKFHTYENVGYDASDQHLAANYIAPKRSTSPPLAPAPAPAPMLQAAGSNGHIGSIGCGNSNGLVAASPFGGSIAVNKTGLELSFGAEPALQSDLAQKAAVQTAKILSTATDSTGVTRMLTAAAPSSSSVAGAGASGSAGAVTSATAAAVAAVASHRAPPGQNLVTKLITFPAQSPMDSLKEWSVSTFKCTKQLINERRGTCPVTNDSQLQNDIELLRENRAKLLQMLRYGQQMASHYGQLVRTQRQLHALMSEMSIKCFNTTTSTFASHPHGAVATAAAAGNSNHQHQHASSKQVVANFSSLGNNLSSSTTTAAAAGAASPSRRRHLAPQPSVTSNQAGAAELHSFEDFLPVLNHMKSAANLNLVEDFKRNAITLNAAIKNGEKLLAALNFYCANLSTLINKTIEDTLATVKQYEAARLEYDAEKNSLNFISPAAQSSMTYSSEKLELARMRYEQLKEDVQIKMRLLEENTTKVMHKQLLIFNGAFASYTSGNTAALDATLKQFSIRDNGAC